MVSTGLVAIAIIIALCAKIHESDGTSVDGSFRSLRRKHNKLAEQVATLQAELHSLKDRMRQTPGWWRAPSNAWYKFFSDEKVTYETAKSRCAAFGGILASAGMREAEIKSVIIGTLLPSPIPHTWIGLDDLVSQGNYVWGDGVASNSSNTEWGAGQPSSISQRCVAAMGGEEYKDMLYDISCDNMYNYLCEY